tara:strand:+ start:26 stop:862 length:837 start_codon:yes stop_codon:yes gene_type:complete
MNKDTNRIMANINAYKMDGLGNNFLIIDKRINKVEINKDKIISIANENIFPFDQLITLENDEKNEHSIKIFNPDGIEVSACGNGARCVAYLIFNESRKKNIYIKTRERVLSAQIVGKKNVKINMGKPKFEWKEIPISESIDTKQVSIDILNKEYGYGFCVNIGNPHIIFFVKDCLKINIKKLGPIIENYKLFPERINVSFAEILNKKNIKINVWERGAGQTKACGTAACAVAIAAFKKALVDKNLQINFKEGNLQIDCENEIFMTGPVSDAVKIKLDI